MDTQEEVSVQCPYCGEMIELLVDCTIAQQEYIEDCQICCRPITIVIAVAEEGGPNVRVRREDD